MSQNISHIFLFKTAMYTVVYCPKFLYDIPPSFHNFRTFKNTINLAGHVPSGVPYIPYVLLNQYSSM